MGMTLVPGLFDRKSQTFYDGSFLTIDAAGEQVAAVFRVPKSGDITKVGVYIGNVTTSKPISVSLQTVNETTGLPTGTMYKGSTAGVQASIASNTFYQVTLGTQATSAVKDNLIAIVTEWNSVDYGNARAAMLYTSGINSTWACSNLGGAGWSKNAGPTYGALEYSDGSYYHTPGVLGCPTPTTLAVNSGTATADEYGNLFNLPIDIVLRGFMVYMTPAAAATYDLCYYTGSTLTEAVSVVPRRDDGAPTTTGWRYIPLLTEYTITKNTDFRLTVRPTNATSILLYQLRYLSSAMLDTDGLSSSQCQNTQRLDLGSFTENTSRRIVIYPWITQVNDSAGGGQIAYGFVG